MGFKEGEPFAISDLVNKNDGKHLHDMLSCILVPNHFEDRKRALKWLRRADENKDNLSTGERGNLRKYMNSILPDSDSNHGASDETVPGQIHVSSRCHDSVSRASTNTASHSTGTDISSLSTPS